MHSIHYNNHHLYFFPQVLTLQYNYVEEMSEIITFALRTTVLVLLFLQAPFSTAWGLKLSLNACTFTKMMIPLL